MSKSKLEILQEYLKEQEESRKNKFSNNSGPSAIFPFWKAKDDEILTIRFLPDGNENNPLLWVESQIIRLSFPGIKGDPMSQPIEFKVPCVEMWSQQCPILGYIRKQKWFDSDSTKALGSQYWKKYSWIFQGFVPEAASVESVDEVPENPIRRFVIRKQLYDVIKAGVQHPDLEASPDDFEQGVDFIIKKTSDSKFPNYGGSYFRSKSRSLDQAERDAVEKYGLKDLDDFRPKKPTSDELDMIFEMFQSSLNGDLYDKEKYGHLPWRPRGVQQESSTATEENESPRVSVPIATKEPDTEAATAGASVAPKTGPSAQDILRQIRNKNNAS